MSSGSKFPFKIIFMDELLFTKDLHVLPNLAFVAIIFGNFDLWMLKGNVGIFGFRVLPL